ncbi:acyl-CoA dehydrogenase [Rubidibacter lacunae KORDI 51-2]|uniref:Acyl-CoA dehydrogenase n=1 Tax=Rubidibacter lacunae KORDI 51-2 TaxID=582515 RepID=U5DH66_9CHRO|nr:acyl-CoA dehydrogenase family protein [Rubidibacter lacunae]ERN40582.1 acyl-CoA dehydrogenase [Rubidibacter lacunae KORDI 51-2]
MPVSPTDILLLRAETYLREIVAPQAGQLDTDSEALHGALRGLGELGGLGLKVPKTWGGAELGDREFRQFLELVPRYSGALSFLQNQHQSASALLASSHNTELKRAYLARAVTGEALIGVGFSHLRREGGSPLKAREVAGSYCLDGTAPWITGAGFFQTFIIGAELSDGSAVYGMAPLRSHQQSGGGELRLSEPMELAAMGSTRTVSAELSAWRLDASQVVGLDEPGAIHSRDRRNVLNHGFYALGCARAGLDVLDRVALQKPSVAIRQTWEQLNRALDALRDNFYTAMQPAEAEFAKRLQLRGQAIYLAGTCARAAVIASGGSANSCQHPAQRVYREALVYSISGQTTAVRDTSLELLVRNTVDRANQTSASIALESEPYHP